MFMLFRLFLPILFSIIFYSCHRASDENRAVDTNFRQAALTQREHFIKYPHLFYGALRYYDSAFSKIDKPGLEDYSLYYSSLALVSYYGHYFSLSLQYADSLEQLLQPIKTRSDSDLIRYAGALFLRGDNYMQLGKYEEAFSNYFQARVIVSHSSSKCAKANYAFRIALVMYKQKRFKEARDLLWEAYLNIDDCPPEDQPVMRKQAMLDDIGLCHYHMGNHDSALYYYEQALDFIGRNRTELRKKYKDLDFSQMAEGVVWGNMAKVYRKQKQYDKAEELLRKSIRINLQNGYEVNDAKITFLELADMFEETQQLNKLEQTLNAFGHILDSLPQAEQQMKWHQLCAKLYSHNKQYTAAYAHLERLNTIRDSLKHISETSHKPDIQQQFSYYEKQFENQLLKKENAEKSTSLWYTIVLTVAVLLVTLMVLYNYIRSKKDLALLKQLNNRINEQNIQLEHALEALEENSRARERIMRVVAHDLRNPISAISSISLLLQDEFNESQVQGKEMVGLIKTTCANSLELIGELLERSTDLSAPLHKEAIDVDTLLQNIVKLLRFKAAEKGQLLMLHSLPTPRTIFADREKMWRILNNLIENAIKFSPDQSTIQIHASGNDKNLLLTISDSGIGIPEAQLPYVFDMFTSVKRNGIKGEKSFGLGLSIVKQFVQAHQGRVWVESETGKGSTFFVELPWQ